MGNKIRHLLGISGGKDSAALAIYLHDKYPDIEFDYYCCDTGKELDETYQLIDDLEIHLGKKITKLISEDARKSEENPFDYYYKSFKGYLPSPQARWCTKLMKLEPFEKHVGDDQVVSYVGIRGDEEREGYISKKNNIQSIFPFRKNIWSEDVLQRFFAPGSQAMVADIYRSQAGKRIDEFRDIQKIVVPTALEDRSLARRRFKEKVEGALHLGVVELNKAIFSFLRSTDYPLAKEEWFPLIENEDVLIRADIFRILEESGVGVPAYYNKLEYEVDGQKGEYARSRSGCFFCFFQQKIEWVWLYEQHPDRFEQAIYYENVDESFTWTQNESLEDLIHPRRIEQIKREHLHRAGKEKSKGSPFLLDILDDTEDESCVACFV